MASKIVTLPVPLLAPGTERRGAERIPAQMPICVEGSEGVTSDLSATGVSFLADKPYEIGATVEMVIEYLLDGHQYPLHCQAEVVRVRPAPGGYAIGARLTAQSGEMLDGRRPPGPAQG
ncbi:MAG: hypothetical protein JWP65_1683 [Ramlibacter sp.]|jgi:hypothetical protein|uniref:PilZ domain-containing protein n=1 Tax=Ramlibacter sp. TaxID=1917967 RepID=UPI0026342F09|nr:PilZ domain-containing protein [Ramlibacter sp.]MDB5751262.1 hypothetical protein [Ramlibacter sp.]